MRTASSRPRRKETEYAIRCFKDGRRKPTHQLTKGEARNFRKAALHLAIYLSSEYGL